MVDLRGVTRHTQVELNRYNETWRCSQKELKIGVKCEFKIIFKFLFKKKICMLFHTSPVHITMLLHWGNHMYLLNYCGFVLTPFHSTAILTSSPVSEPFSYLTLVMLLRLSPSVSFRISTTRVWWIGSMPWQKQDKINHFTIWRRYYLTIIGGCKVPLKE